mmetsp:Transcript_102/g.325  ORF Transcript_102/g.325 Transcript_102/m.325 type:complete len:232 (-) Transcript_102:497-1192(-)
MQPRTGPGSATTYTLRTSRWATWRRCASSRPRRRASRCTTSAPAAATRCWRWWRPSARRPVSRFRTSSSIGALATSAPSTPRRPRRGTSSGGRPSWASRRCARTPGGGPRTTPTASGEREPPLCPRLARAAVWARPWCRQRAARWSRHSCTWPCTVPGAPDPQPDARLLGQAAWCCCLAAHRPRNIFSAARGATPSGWLTVNWAGPEGSAQRCSPPPGGRASGQFLRMQNF